MMIWRPFTVIVIMSATIVVERFSVNAFTASVHQLRRQRAELFGTNAAGHSDNNKLSKKEQDELWESNALCIDNRDQAKLTKHII